jgi:hypothetical protein
MRVTFGKVIFASWMLCVVVLFFGPSGDRDPHQWTTGFVGAGSLALAILLTFVKLIHVFVSWFFSGIDLSKHDKNESK